MYEIEIINQDAVPTWMRGTKELNNSKAEYWEKTGAIKLIRKFRYSTVFKRCKFGVVHKFREKIEWEDER